MHYVRWSASRFTISVAMLNQYRRFGQSFREASTRPLTKRNSLPGRWWTTHQRRILKTMTDVTKKPSCPQCGANIRAQAKFCPACGAILRAPPVPQRGDIQFQDSTQVQGDVISANEVHKHTSQWVQIGAPIAATLVISIALIAVAQISGYNIRLWLQDGQPPGPTTAAATATPALQQADLTPLVGIWQVSRQTDSGSSLVDWDITIARLCTFLTTTTFEVYALQR